MPETSPRNPFGLEYPAWMEMQRLQKRIELLESESEGECKRKLIAVYNVLRKAMPEVRDGRIQSDVLSLADVAAKEIVNLREYAKGLSEVING
jgi:hypothetical protein